MIELLLDYRGFITLVIGLFLIGLSGVVSGRRSLISVLISIELILLAINVGFIGTSIYCDDLIGQIFALFVLAVAASESAIGLALIVLYFRLRGSIFLDSVSSLKG